LEPIIQKYRRKYFVPSGDIIFDKDIHTRIISGE
jgi:hypothetical protein